MEEPFRDAFGKTSPCLHARGSPLPCLLRCFQAPRCPLPATCCVFIAQSVTMLFAGFQAPRCPLPCYLRCFPDVRCRAICAGICKVLHVRNSASMLFARFSSMFGIRFHAICKVVAHAECVLRLYYKSRLSSHGSSGRLQLLRLYYKSRLSSHGSFACPQHTTFVLQKSTFPPPQRQTFPAMEAPRVPSVLRLYCVLHLYYKSRFPATEAPRVPSIQRLYYKSRLSRHESVLLCLLKSTFQPRKSPAYCVCTAKVDKEHRNTAVLAPAEGLRLHVKKRKNTTVLAPCHASNPAITTLCGFRMVLKTVVFFTFLCVRRHPLRVAGARIMPCRQMLSVPLFRFQAGFQGSAPCARRHRQATRGLPIALLESRFFACMRVMLEHCGLVPSGDSLNCFAFRKFRKTSVARGP